MGRKVHLARTGHPFRAVTLSLTPSPRLLYLRKVHHRRGDTSRRMGKRGGEKERKRRIDLESKRSDERLHFSSLLLALVWLTARLADEGGSGGIRKRRKGGEKGEGEGEGEKGCGFFFVPPPPLLPVLGVTNLTFFAIARLLDRSHRARKHEKEVIRKKKKREGKKGKRGTGR